MTAGKSKTRELPGRESPRDVAEAATMSAKKKLNVQVELLQMETQNLQRIADRLTQIATSIALANGIVARVADDEEGEGGGG